MSYSLQVANGDLVLQGGQLSIVAGAQKLLQDLSCWILTRMGTDSYDPGFGSLIDGGIQANGIIVTSPIGTTNWATTQTLIQQDITRIIAAYQSQQNNQLQQELSVFNKTSLTDDQILTGLNNISFSSDFTTLTVTVSITNKSGQALTMIIPVQGTVL